MKNQSNGSQRGDAYTYSVTANNGSKPVLSFCLSRDGYSYLLVSFSVEKHTHNPIIFSTKSSRRKSHLFLSDFSMGKYGLFDLEKHFSFYGAYHSNPINILIHMIFVWPIFFASSLILYFTPPLFNLPQVELSLFGSNDVVLFLNIGFFLVLIYALFYICLDPKAGSLAALICVFCWVSSCFVACWLGFSLAWKVILFPVIFLVFGVLGIEQ